MEDNISNEERFNESYDYVNVVFFALVAVVSLISFHLFSGRVTPKAPAKVRISP